MENRITVADKHQYAKGVDYTLKNKIEYLSDTKFAYEAYHLDKEFHWSSRCFTIFYYFSSEKSVVSVALKLILK